MVASLDDVLVCSAPCSECGVQRTLGLEQTALAVVPAACPGRHEVIVDVSVTILAGCERCYTPCA
jgi:hypothetical protein